MSHLPSISSLMSPPELKRFDSFNSSPKSYTTPPPASGLLSYTPENTLPPIKSSHSPDMKAVKVLPSPPVSPWTGHIHQVDHNPGGVGGGRSDGGMIRDPVLYPATSPGEITTSNRPLFPTTPQRLVAEEMVAKHMSYSLQDFDRKVDRPTRDEYLLALSLVSKIGTMYNQNPGAYLKRAREETDEYYSKAKRICARPGKTTTTTTIRIAPAPSSTARPPRKPTSTGPKKLKEKHFVRVRNGPKVAPLDQRLGTPALDRARTPDSKTPAAKRPEDVDYLSLPDFCPPTSTLPPNNPKSLKTDWASNNPLDLSTDPDRHIMHDAELNLASTLRLTCATYLCSKRRIFEGRLHAYKVGKEFRKTDAQQACKIDVNKASKLWTAYEKVGWFSKGHFQKWL
ncbi:hypothetical protein MMC19_007770 [Ptychographa xylographoides]|nr:hypothetical protein [Ptychographa xylographoides]